MLSQNRHLKSTWPIFVQIAQTHRKPRWLPVAKSKIYRIPKRPVISVEERMELSRINNNYKTQMRAIKRFYHEEMIKEKSTLQSADSELSQSLEAEEWEQCVKLNDQWNAQIAQEREERRKLELAALEERAMSLIEERDREFKARIEKASSEIKLQKELSATFITPESLDEAIDHALANPVDYNFAIDLQGHLFKGRDTDVSVTEDEEKKIASVKA